MYALAVEKLLRSRNSAEGAVDARHADANCTRLNSHLVWLGTHALDIGAMSVFFYCFREREDILRIFEMFSGPADDDQLHPHRRTGAWSLRAAGSKAVQQVHRRLPGKVDEYEEPADQRIRSG